MRILDQDLSLKIYCIALIFIIGAVFGSFFNCLAYRLVHKESIIKGRSHCVKCGHELGALDLFPIFSYIFLKGKCRYCKEKIAIRYPLSELLLAILSVLVLLRFDLSISMLKMLIFTFCLFTLSVCDLDDFIIPDRILVAAIVNWVIFLPFINIGLWDNILHAAALIVFTFGLLIFTLIFEKFAKKESMGGGDIKLIGVCALYLGFARSLFMLILACFIGIIFAMLTKYRKENEEKHFPFGPSIAVATFIMFMYGDGFINWYISLL